MEEFIKKYGGQGSQPYEAVDLMSDKVHRIKHKVEIGDHNVIPELQELSSMLDEFAMYSKQGGFQPRHEHGNFQGQPYQNYQGQGGQGQPGQTQGQPSNVYDPYRTVGSIGYKNHWYPQIYPMYPFYNRDRQGQDIGDYRPEYRPDYVSPRDEYGRDGRDGYNYPNPSRRAR